MAALWSSKLAQPCCGRSFCFPRKTPRRSGKIAPNATEGAIAGATQGAGSPPQPPKPVPTAQAPDPQRFPQGALVLTWPRDWWAFSIRLVALAWVVGAAIETAVHWWLQKTESVVETQMLSRRGDNKVITKGDLPGVFREATSSQLGDARLLVKSDLDSAVRQLHLLLKI